MQNVCLTMAVKFVTENKINIEIFLSNGRLEMQMIEKIVTPATISTNIFFLVSQRETVNIFPSSLRKHFIKDIHFQNVLTDSIEEIYNFTSILEIL